MSNIPIGIFLSIHREYENDTIITYQLIASRDNHRFKFVLEKIDREREKERERENKLNPFLPELFFSLDLKFSD